MQWAVLCEDIIDTDGGKKWNIVGVAPEYRIISHWRADLEIQPDLFPLDLTFALSFIEGSPGLHELQLVAKPPKTEKPVLFDPQQMEWASDSIAQTITAKLEKQLVPPISGFWHFIVFVDKKPVGETFVPIYFTIRRGDA